MAKGLRRKFGAVVPSLAPALFDKFKEKKPVLRDPLLECVDAVCATTNLEALSEHIVVSISKPNPDIKKQMDLLLYRLVKDLKPEQIPKKLLKDLIPILAKHTGDPDAEVRDASCAALGGIMKCVGKQTAAILFSAIASDRTKMIKVEEFCERADEEEKQ